MENVRIYDVLNSYCIWSFDGCLLCLFVLFLLVCQASAPTAPLTPAGHHVLTIEGTSDTQAIIAWIITA